MLLVSTHVDAIAGTLQEGKGRKIVVCFDANAVCYGIWPPLSTELYHRLEEFECF